MADAAKDANDRDMLMAKLKFQRPLMMDPELGKELGNALLSVRRRALMNLIKVLIACSAGLTFFVVWALLSAWTWGDDSPPLLVVVSIDGMRFDMLQRGVTPNMQSMARTGVSAPLKPQFPAHTFPNHFTMVTGLYPARHGIVGNVFFDPRTESVFAYDNTTLIWNTVQLYGLKSASVFWPGSEAVIGGMRPNVFFPYDNSWTSAMRINKVIELTLLPVGQRPNLITAYLSILDEIGHQKGPFSDEVNHELNHIDRLIGELKRIVVDQLKGNLVIVSDHGMVDLPPSQHLLLSDWLPNYKERVVFADFGPVCSIIPKRGQESSILEDLKFGQKSGAPFKVYTPDTIPVEWNYFNNDRIAPIIVQCDKGWTIDRRPKATKLKGQHGYDPSLPEMQAVFLANGPGFREASAYTTPFQNTDLYSLFNHLLWIQRDESRDGSEALSLAALRYES